MVVYYKYFFFNLHRRVKVLSENLTIFEILKFFFTVHWRGVLTTVTPLIFLFVILPLPAPVNINKTIKEY